MSYVFESDVENFKGKVYFPEFYTLPQLNGFRAANERTRLKSLEYQDTLFPVSVRNEMMAPELFACIERMEIENQPEHPTLNTFRATPMMDGDTFLAHMIIEVTRLIMGQSELPNA